VWSPVDPEATIRGDSMRQIEPFGLDALGMECYMKKTYWNSFSFDSDQEPFSSLECPCYAQSLCVETPSMPFCYRIPEILQSFNFYRKSSVFSENTTQINQDKDFSYHFTQEDEI